MSELCPIWTWGKNRWVKKVHKCQCQGKSVWLSGQMSAGQPALLLPPLDVTRSNRPSFLTICPKLDQFLSVMSLTDRFILTQRSFRSPWSSWLVKMEEDRSIKMLYYITHFNWSKTRLNWFKTKQSKLKTNTKLKLKWHLSLWCYFYLRCNCQLAKSPSLKVN